MSTKPRVTLAGRRNSQRAAVGGWLIAGLLLLLPVEGTAADFRLRYGGEPIHPACVHALAMQSQDAVPVTTAVSLEGCSASDRSRSPVRFEGDFAVFEDEALLAGGSFAYRELTQLENGIVGVVIRRRSPDGEEQVSLAAVDIRERPMVRQGRVIRVQMLELLGEIWIPGVQLLSFRSAGNLVHFDAGVGPRKVERTVDFTELGKLRR